MAYTFGLKDVNGARVATDVSSYLLHQGNVWTSTYINMGLADNGTAYFIWTSGTTYHKHVGFSVTAGGDAIMAGCQGATIVDMGTAMTNHNRMVGGSNVTDVTIYQNGSLSACGTTMFSVFIPGGQKNSASGALRSSTGEWIVPASVGTFVLSVINQAGSEKPIGVEFNWYEED